MLNRAYAVVDIKSADEEARIIHGVATTPEPDRLGDVVEPLGAKFALPMPLLWQHKSDQPVGHVEVVNVSDKGIEFRAKLARTDEPGNLKSRLDEAWQSLKANLIRGVSIGFRSLKHEMMESGGLRFKEWEWLELSLVTIPANAGASITAIRSIDHELRAALGHEQDEGGRREPPGASGKSTTVVKARKEPKKMKTIAEQISAFEATRQAKAARMKELMDASGETGETLGDAETEEYDTLADEVKSIDAHLKRLDDMEKLNRETVRPVNGNGRSEAAETRGVTGGNGGYPVVQVRNEKLPPGIEFTRYAMCLLAAKGNHTVALNIAKTRYPNDQRILNVLKAGADGNPMDEIMIARAAVFQELLQQHAAVVGGTTTDSLWAAPLVDFQQFAGDFVEFLRPATIVGRFGTGGIPSLRRVPFNIQIPAQISGGAGYWVGEGAPKPLTRFNFERHELRWAKVANIAVLTEELIRFSNPSAEALVRDGLRDALVERIDTDFVDPAKAAVANVSPASITNGITPIVSSGTDADAVRTDVQAGMQRFITDNLPLTGGVWIMNPRIALGLSLMTNALGQREFPDISILGGSFLGFPVITSNYVTDVIFVLAPEIWLSDDGGFTIDASREATLQMLDNPTNNSATATPTTGVSMFQTNSVALRAERFINWQRRRDEAVVYWTDVDWGGSGLSGT